MARSEVREGRVLVSLIHPLFPDQKANLSNEKRDFRHMSNRDIAFYVYRIMVNPTKSHSDLLISMVRFGGESVLELRRLSFQVCNWIPSPL